MNMVVCLVIDPYIIDKKWTFGMNEIYCGVVPRPSKQDEPSPNDKVRGLRQQKIFLWLCRDTKEYLP